MCQKLIRLFSRKAPLDAPLAATNGTIAF